MNSREYNNNEEVIMFNSQSKYPYYLLSNFAHIKDGIMFNNIIYPSTEHAFQSQKYVDSDKIRFSINGDLGSIDEGFDLVFQKDSDKKKKYWMKKDNIGIIAKMATNKSIGIRLGLKRDPVFESTDELWIDILNEKYKIDEFKNILMNTNNKYLLEFDRGAKKNNPVWSGIIENGVLYGNNKMGKYLMMIREK
jgi:predicted NAD-dependent protein-ADP-ribosyltransferase YbiA (DUF1768 family)